MSISNMPGQTYRRTVKWLAISWLICLLSAFVTGIVIAPRVNIDTDLLTLLPRDERNPQAEKALNAMAEHGERQLVILIGSQDTDQAQQAARTYRKMLDGLPLTAQQAESSLDALTTLYKPYRRGLLNDADRRWLAQSDQQAQIKRSLTLAYGTFSQGSIAWQEDPFGLYSNWLMTLGEASPVRPEGDTLMVHSETRHYAVLLYTLTDSAFSRTTQQTLQTALDTAEKTLRQQQPGIDILHAGVILHAAAAATSAESEISTIGIGSMLASLALVWLIFRTWRALRLILLSLGSGALIALTVCALTFERIHMLTLVFGATLIGVAVDYGILVLTQHFEHDTGKTSCSLRRDDSPQTVQPVRQGESTKYSMNRGATINRWQLHRRLLPTLSLVLITPALAYLGLLLMPFPGLKQMALFAICGIAGAWLTIMLWYPFLLPAHLPLTNSARKLGNALRYWPRWQATRRQWLLAVIVIALLGGGLLQLRANDDIRSLVSGNRELLQQHIQVSKLLGLPSPAQMYLIEGNSPEQVLQSEERLISRLHPLIADGRLSGYDAISRWLPSQQSQRQAQQLQQRLNGALPGIAADLELDQQWITRQQQSAPLLTTDIWLKQPVTQPFHYLWLGRDDNGHYTSMVLLKGLASPQTARTLAGFADDRHVQWLDKTVEVSDLMGRHRIMLSWLLVAAYLLTPLALYRFYRQNVWRVIAPSLLATLCTLAVMGYTGIPVQLLTVLTLLLVLGMGVDYAIFFQARHSDNRAFVAITVAASLTILSFGLLSFSSTPALHALGLATTLGIGLTWLLTPLFRSNNH